MTVFGDSSRIYDVERDSSFLDSGRLEKFFHRVSYKVFVLKDRLIISKHKIIETGVVVLYSINNRRICAYVVPMLQIFV